MIYTWVSSLNHWTQLFPNSEKLFRRGLKRIVAASEWEFRANNKQTNKPTNQKEKQSSDLSPALCQDRSEMSKAKLAFQSLLLLAISSTLRSLRDCLRSEWEKYINTPFWWEAFSPWGCAKAKDRTRELTNACKDQEASAGLGEGSKSKLQRKEKRHLKRDLMCREGSRAKPRHWILWCSKKQESTSIRSP